MDNHHDSATLPRIMKSDSLNGILTFVLGCLIVAGVCLALRMALLTHELHKWQKEASTCQAIILQTQSVYNDATAYNQTYKDPRLAQILSIITVKSKPGTH